MFWEMGGLVKVLKTVSTFCALLLLTPPIYAASVLVQSLTSTHVVHSHSSQVVSRTTGNVVGNATRQDGQGGAVVSGTSVHTHEVSVSRTSVGTSGNVEIHTSGTTGNVENTVSASFRYELIDLSGIIRGASKPGRKFYRAVGRKISHMAFLEKYGYLIPNGVKHTWRAERNALTTFQRFAGINQTGEMDDTTQMIMDSSRCGVEDMLGSSRMGSMNKLQTNGTSKFIQVIENVVNEAAGDVGESTTTDHQVGVKRWSSFRHRSPRYSIQGSEWKKVNITYHFKNFSPDLTEAQIRDAVSRAFQLWADVTTLTFRETSDPKAADIVIRFATGVHGDGAFAAFDGPGGTLAHAFFPENGDLHFDDDETFSVGSEQDTDLFIVAAHEIGHSLGLEHSSDMGALMYPWYLGYQHDYALSQDDIDGIQQIYGKPALKRKEMEMGAAPTNPPNPNLPDACNSTWDAATYYSVDDVVYAFKGRYLWAIGDNRILPGYPKKTRLVFKGAPSLVHAVLSIGNRLYMFRGRKMWRFVDRQLDEGFPRRVPAGLPSGPNAGFRWGGNGKLYLFKGFRFYEFDEQTLSVGPPQTIRRQWPDVPVKIDAAFQWKNGRTYFFKGDDFWRYNDSKMKLAGGYPVSKAKYWLGCDNQSIGTFIIAR
ncbi:stromelysin-3-like [Strongylocentrotus purpuratus]|uniref:Peptidase metallopeptidase domain-containing protein n=1 Tax=Strongylocentrotus purpuratus TaxID=7668 RepID=A0A7M7PCI1_STRPU|nr:stromelysin-3-like [Strongylocentrotus purpuratus]